LNAVLRPHRSRGLVSCKLITQVCKLIKSEKLADRSLANGTLLANRSRGEMMFDDLTN
jgi:hypothetical protein